MTVDDRMGGALQENVLTLLCFDDKTCKLMRAAVTPRTFESAVFRDIAGIAIDFIDRYGEAVKEHLPDHLEHVLKGEDKRKASTYERLLVNLHASKDTVNAEYVVSQLHKFVRQQNLKAGLVLAVEAIEAGRPDDAEVAMQRALSARVTTFEPGLSLGDADSVTALLQDYEEPGFKLGIPEFDRRGIYPRKKELFMFIAPRGRGKSWFCTHVAKMALLQRWSALIVTLEMGEKPYAVRMVQSFYSVTRRRGETRVARLVHGRDGSLSDVVHELVDVPALEDDDTQAMLSKQVKRDFRRRKPLKIKQFPTSTFTLAHLNAYLDSLEQAEGWTPDLLVIDYPDLMAHNIDNKRLELGRLIEGIRGVCVERNMAGVVPSQGNRASETSTTVTQDQAAEDISKVATADTVVTMSRTRMEHKLGLARLLADKVRNEEDKVAVLITQAYGIGQFCIDSTRLRDDYWDVVGPNDDEDEDQPRVRGRGRDR